MKGIDFNTLVTMSPAQIEKAIAVGIKDGLNAVSVVFFREIQKQLSKPGTGTHYPSQRYRSSRPGGTPAVQTGRLRNSFVPKMARISRSSRGYTARVRQSGSPGVESPVKYGWILETSKRLKRSYIKGPGRALDKTRAKAQRVFQSEFVIGVNNANKSV